MPRAFLSAAPLALVLLLSACAAGERAAETARPPQPAPAATGATAATTTAAPANTNADMSADTTTREGSGSFKEYRFTYRRTGHTAEAVFAPRRLPWNDNAVVAAAREVIAAAFDDKSENFPRGVRWEHRGETVNAVKLEGEKYEYVFVPVRETNGEAREVRSVVFWRLAKGTVK